MPRNGQTSTTLRPRKPGRSREQVKEVLRRAFRAEFPEDTVDISDGYQGNIHVLVVSREFDLMSPKEKPAFMWRIIDKSGLTRKEKDLVSLLLPYSPAELK
jgi:hypothetical protein